MLLFLTVFGCSKGEKPPAAPVEIVQPTCDSAADCTILFNECAMAATHVNQKVATRNSLQPLACTEDALEPVYPDCKAGVCVAEKTELAQYRRGCKTAAECTLIPGACSHDVAVLNRKVDAATGVVSGMMNVIGECDEASVQREVYGPICLNNYCVESPK